MPIIMNLLQVNNKMTYCNMASRNERVFRPNSLEK